MTFYVNIIVDAGTPSCTRVGLFTDNSWTGTGNIFYEKKTDVYRDTTLLAYGEHTRDEDEELTVYVPFDKGVTVTDAVPHQRISVADKRYEVRFQAETTEEAIHIFKEQTY